MSETDGEPTAEGARLGSVGRTVSRTAFAVRAVLARTDARLVLLGVTLGYLLAYLYALGHLTPGGDGVELLVVSDPLSRMVEPTGTLTWEPVARLGLPFATLLVSPLDLLVGLGLAVLVGANLAVTYLAWRQPKACGLTRSSSGVLAAVPALLSGAACCGPVVLVVLGVQASGVLLTAFSALVPLAAVLLVASLLWVGRQVDPGAV
ncbi:hypothetical protein [Halomicrococcus sp. NG-SE-24]|uniref:hypothetical protein n=1 Tax=Halomicrococcus sp. NG-SE-24 TaxID=3436928 RepID=UPI003D97C4AF